MIVSRSIHVALNQRAAQSRAAAERYGARAGGSANKVASLGVRGS
jgi:hypothetical protein